LPLEIPRAIPRLGQKLFRQQPQRRTFIGRQIMRFSCGKYKLAIACDQVVHVPFTIAIVERLSCCHGDFVGHGLRRKLNSKETRKGHSHNKANDNQPSQQAGQNKDVATTSIFSNARYHIPSCRPKKDALRWCDYWYERICDIRASESDSIRICTA